MSICDNCHQYKVFGAKCWFYWEGKKSCSQHKKESGDEPSYTSELIHITNK